MALLDHTGDIPEEYLTSFEREMQEVTSEEGKEDNIKTWKEYAKGYVPYDSDEVSYEDIEYKTGWTKDKEDLKGQTLTGTYQTQSSKQGKVKEQADRQYQLLKACKAGDRNACLLIQANIPQYIQGKQQAKQELLGIPMYKRTGFAEGGLMDDSSRLWKMESTYPEFEKGITRKGVIPTAPIEEEYMYSPTQQGYAEGGSVYDTEGSMLAPEVPLDFEDEAPIEEMPVEENELGLTDGETEVLGQAMSDYPELEDILNKVGSTFGTGEFTADGAVEGPGTETSDSIPARLSDGEFVFTAKAVKQLGVDKLRKMMDKAEGDYDEAAQKQEYQQMSDTGFAKGGFFDRPAYDDGGTVQEQPQGESKGFGSTLKDMLMGVFTYTERGIDPDSWEDYESEEYKENKRWDDWIHGDKDGNRPNPYTDN